MPKDANLQMEFDCMSLDCIPSYRAQLVRLCLAEKGVKWCRFNVDIHKKMDNLQLWYVKLNPGAYVPTLLVHPNNTPVCESIEICKYIENNFNGTCSLLNPQGCDEERVNAVKARFE